MSRRSSCLSGRSTDPKVNLLVLLMGLGCGACGPDSEPESPDEGLAGCTWGSTGGEEDGGGGGFELRTESPEFQEYLANHVVEYQDGWIVEGDMFAGDFEDVVRAFQRFEGSTLPDEGFRGTVKCDDDLPIDEVLDPARKLNLSYCLDDSWDAVPEFRDVLVEALRTATGHWESAADLNFIELEAGSSCSHANGAFFVVEYGGSLCTLFGCLNGLAFFPNDPPEDRTVYFYEDLFTHEPTRPVRLAAHELGHVLGLYHEQARFDGVGCSLGVGDPEQWRGVTDGDAASIMSYPVCEDTHPSVTPSALDRLTVAHLYNLPRPLRGTQESDSGVLVWHRPQSADFIVWEPDGAGGFISSGDCYLAQCEPGDAARWKPLLFNEAGSVDALMYGPGELEDVRVRDFGGAWSSDSTYQLGTNNDVPVLLDDFFAPQDRSLWWIRPEERSDHLWRNLAGAVSGSNAFDEQPFTDGSRSVVHGRFDGGPHQTLWVDPLDNAIYQASADGDELEQLVVSKLGCFLENDVAYDAIPGDYDGDGRQEVVWYDFEAGELIYWGAVPNCLGASSKMLVGQGKPAAIRLERDAIRLMLYRPGEQQVNFYDVATQELVDSRPIDVDGSPILRDLNRDGCTDILWFTPERVASELWSSNCNGGFASTLVQTPIGAYPLGYGLGHGRD